jgi:type IV secretory pathway component VirB8
VVVSDTELPYDVWHSLRRTNIVLAVLLVIMTLSVLFFAGVAAKYYAKGEKIIPVFYEFQDETRRIVRVEQGNMRTDKASLLRSWSMRDYLESREIINHIDEAERYKKVRAMSSKKVFEKFANVYDPNKNKESPLTDESFTREVEIKADDALKPKGRFDLHRVEFVTIDKIDGKEIARKNWVALIEYDVTNARVSYDDRFLNLDGVKVMNYSINPL